MLSPSVTAVAPDYDKGIELLSKRDFDAALKEFRGVVATKPDHAEAHFQIGRILLAGNRAAAAIESFAKAAEIKPAAKINWQAWAEAIALGGNAAARADFLAALKSASVDTGLRVQLQDRFGSMRSAPKPKLGGVPKNAVQSLLALMKSQNYVRAENAAKRLMAAHPKSALVANILATAQASQKKDNLAHANYKKAIKLDPAYFQAYDNYGRFLLSSNLPLEAANNFKKAVTLAPDTISALVGLASAFLRTNENRPAVVLLERARAIDPKNIQALTELGNAYLRSNAHEAALEAYETARVLSKDEISHEHRVSLAQMQLKVNQDENAQKNLERVLREDPNNTPAITVMAGILQSLGNFGEAREQFARAIKVDPNSGENYRQLVASYKCAPDDPIIEEMRNLHKKENLNDIQRLHLDFALAKALEDSKDFGGVFEFLNEANALVRKSAPYKIQKRYDEVRSLKKVYADFDYGGALKPSTSVLDPIFVTGMPRSGTTLVEQIIASHSSMTGAGELGIASRLATKLITADQVIRPISDIDPVE
ncbi:MAG: tetratricopeptide repeat protein, partial [Boseongicola sp.]